MRLLTLYIANKADHVVNFDTWPSTPETYIVQQSRTTSTELFAFYHRLSSAHDGRTYAATSRRGRNVYTSATPAPADTVILQTDQGELGLYVHQIEVSLPTPGPSMSSAGADGATSPDGATATEDLVISVTLSPERPSEAQSAPTSDVQAGRAASIASASSAAGANGPQFCTPRLTGDGAEHIVPPSWPTSASGGKAVLSKWPVCLRHGRPGVQAVQSAYGDHGRAAMIERVRLSLCLKEHDQETGCQDILLCVAPDDQINDIVVDFGSEASQMAIFKRNGSMTTNNICDIFPSIKSLLGATQKDCDYMQFEDAQLFRSTFYARQAFTSQEAGHPLWLSGRPQADAFAPSPLATSPQADDATMCVTSSQPDAAAKDNASDSPDAMRSATGSRPIHDTHIAPAAASPRAAELPTQPLLRLLTTETEAQRLLDETDKGWILLPNTKIAHFDVPLPKVTIDGVPSQDTIAEYDNGFFYRASVGHFLLAALRASQSRPYVNLCLLMPNVYRQEEIGERLAGLRHDLSSMLRHDPILSERIKGVELTSISESDASLVGALQHVRLEDNGRYVIIDAGKGTIDISCILYRSDAGGNNIESCYRSGFIGAGASLTYACFIGLMHDMLTEALSQPHDVHMVTDDELRDYIAHVLLGIGHDGSNPATDAPAATADAVTSTHGQPAGAGDQALIAQLWTAVEAYKKALSGKPDGSIKAFTNESMAHYNRPSDIPIAKAIEYVRHMVKGQSYKPLSPAAQQYVDVTIADITSEIERKLTIGLKAAHARLQAISHDAAHGHTDAHPQGQAQTDALQADGYILAGRAFRMQQFSKAVREMLGSHAHAELTFVSDYSTATEKNICLFVRSMMDSYNSHMMGAPITLTQRAKQESKPQPADSTRTQASPNILKKGFKKLISLLGSDYDRLEQEATQPDQAPQPATNIFERLTDFVSSRTPLYQAEQNYSQVGATHFNGMVEGFDIEVKTNNDILIIGGSEYPVSVMKIRPGDYKLFFTGQAAELRRVSPAVDASQSTHQIRYTGQNLETSPLVFATLFPNVRPSKPVEIKLPRRAGAPTSADRPTGPAAEVSSPPSGSDGVPAAPAGPATQSGPTPQTPGGLSMTDIAARL